MNNQLWFGKYKPIRLLKVTDIAEVFLVQHNGFDEKRIMKRVDKQIPECQLLRNEVKNMQKVKHQGIPIVYDLEEDEKYLYIVEEYIKGESFAEYRRLHGAFTKEQIVTYGILLC